MKQNKSQRANPSKKGNANILTAAIKAQIAVVVSALALLLIFCGISISSEDPDSMIKPLSLCALFLSAFFGGLTAVRLSGDGILSGICSGGITVLLVMLLSFLPLTSLNDPITTKLVSLLCILASSCAGAIIGKRRTTSKKLHKARYRK